MTGRTPGYAHLSKDLGQRLGELFAQRGRHIRKPGRPPEDRLGRQHEILLAVAPLIERYGAKRLTMRQAARAAHLSLGGLYHYFPTKRDLVLHALTPEAVARLCEEIRRLGRSVRRTFFSALIDRTVTPDELRHELLSLIQGWPATAGKQAPPQRLKVIAEAAT